MSATQLQGIAGALQAEGLRPIIDPVLEVVRAECPDCRAGERDPLGLYRPLLIVPRARRVIGRCDACGRSSDV